MNTEKHQYLVNQGYAVQEREDGYYPTRNGERLEITSYGRREKMGPYRTREAAWDAAGTHSYAT